jgi:phosphoglycolate phosphatase-like HAD superfamily hydrolase
MSGIRAVIFDMDGTIISLGKNYGYVKTFSEIFKEVLNESTGKDFSGFTDRQFYSAIRLPYEKSINILSNWGIDDPESFWNNIKERDLLARKDVIGTDILVYPDASHILDRIKREGSHVRCGILTNTPENITRLQLGKLGILDSFDELCCFDYNEPNSKPSPWGIKEMLNKWKVGPEEAWIFGDAEQDVIAGKAAGINCGLLSRNGHASEYSKDADVRGRDLIELWSKANEMQMRQ